MRMFGCAGGVGSGRLGGGGRRGSCEIAAARICEELRGSACARGRRRRRRRSTMLVDAGRRWQMLADADTYSWSYGGPSASSTHLLGKSPLAAVSELGTTRGHYRCTHTHSVQSQHSFPSSNPAAIPSMAARIPQCGHSAAASPARRMQHYTTQTDTTVRPPVSRHPRPGSRIIGDGQQAVGSGGGGCWVGGAGMLGYAGTMRVGGCCPYRWRTDPSSPC